MFDRHPDRATLEQFLDGDLPEGESRSLQRHLFLCPVCEDRMIALLPGSKASPHPAADEGYRGLIHRLLTDNRTEIASRRHDLTREQQVASGLWREIEPHPLDEALLLELKAPLRRVQGRYDEALELLAEAIAIYREVNEPHLQGRALMVKGLVLRYQGNLEGAADCFRTSLFLLDGLRDPRLLVTAQYNLIGCLEAAGHGAEAATLIPEARALMEQAGTRSDLIRLRWTEGRVSVLLGRLAEAEAALLEVRESFVADARAFDAAQVSLDLAALYLRQGRSEETRLLAAELIPIFQSRDIYREALAAVIVFQQAAAMEQLTASLVEEIAAYLERARGNPELRFRDTEPVS